MKSQGDQNDFTFSLFLIKAQQPSGDSNTRPNEGHNTCLTDQGSHPNSQSGPWNWVWHACFAIFELLRSEESMMKNQIFIDFQVAYLLLFLTSFQQSQVGLNN